MAGQDIMTEKHIKDSENWCRLAMCTNIHLKQALTDVLHNKMKNVTVTALPSDSTQLYTFMVHNKNTLDSSFKKRILKKDQYDTLLPHSKMVDSAGNWNEPQNYDHSIAAAVFRATGIRNQIAHFNDITSLNEMEFKDLWNQIECIMIDLCYTEDISLLKTKSLDSDGVREATKQFHANMAEDFEKILSTYKDDCTKSQMPNFIERNFAEKSSGESISIKNLDRLLQNNDAILISGEAGLGKTYSAKDLRYKWSTGEILDGKKMLYVDSKRVIKEMYKPSFAAPVCVSELRDILNNKTDDYLASFGCVRKSIEDHVVVIDGVDELSIDNYLDKEYLNKLRIKIDNNEDISGMETIVGIYFGFFFPGSKLIVFGRKHEMDRLKDVQNQVPESNIFDKSKRAELELQPLGENGIKELINRISCNKTNCECMDCSHIYQKVQDVEFRNIPSHLVSFLKVFKSLPDKNIGRMTKSKLFICTLFNLLKNHSQTVVRDVKTFRKLLVEISRKFTESIRNIAQMSYLSLLDGNVTIQVEEFNENNVIYLKYEQTIRGVNHCIKIERDIMEKMDLFYIRDIDYYFILEPYHLTNMEFLTACYIFCHKDEWELLLEIKNNDRKLVILSYLAGLFADDYFTRDFNTNVFSNSNYSIEQFFAWLCNLGDIRNKLPDGGYGYERWYVLNENQKLTPLYLMDSIRREIEIPELYIPKTFVCYCDNLFSFEWYKMEYFLYFILTKQNNSDSFNNIQTFLNHLNNYNIIIKGRIEINNDRELELINEFYDNDKITFRIDRLNICRPLTIDIEKEIKLNELNIRISDSSTLDILLSALSTPTLTHIPTPSTPTITTPNIINVGTLSISTYMLSFDARQTEQLFEIGLCSVDNITLYETLPSRKQFDILSAVESKNGKQINFKLEQLDSERMLELPSLGTRHVSLYWYNNRVNFPYNMIYDKDLIKLKAHITPHNQFNYSNFNNYKIISNDRPFLRKNNSTTDCSFYLHLSRVDFSAVSQNVFASTFSVIPTLECEDHSISSSHWNELSRTEETQINEFRIWRPTLNNLEYFVKIKTNALQLICGGLDKLKEVLVQIANSAVVQLDKTMKVFVVIYDENNYDYYEEIVVFSEETIEEFKNNYSKDILRLNQISETIPYYEGEQHLKNWCCEIRFSGIIKETKVSEITREIKLSEIIKEPEVNEIIGEINAGFEVTEKNKETKISEITREIELSEIIKEPEVNEIIGEINAGFELSEINTETKVNEISRGIELSEIIKETEVDEIIGEVEEVDEINGGNEHFS